MNAIFIGLLFFVWFGLLLWTIMASVFGIITKKERWCLITMMDALSTIFAINLVIGPHHHLYTRMIFSVFTVINARSTHRSYLRWKNTDDDDEWKGRRKSWAKSKLPKPITRTIPQPI